MFKKELVTFVILLFLCLAVSPSIYADKDILSIDSFQKERLEPNILPFLFSNTFGFSVSISGDYMIFGEPAHAFKKGSVHIYKKDIFGWQFGWQKMQEIYAFDGRLGDGFGISVCIYGDYAVVGRHLDYKNGYESGSAYIYKRNENRWELQQKLLPSDGAAYDWFGCSVSMDGEYVAIGAHGDDDNDESSGSVYIFKRNGLTWVEQAKLLPSDGERWDDFGWSVSIDGNFVLIGAKSTADLGILSGSAYIFEYDGVNWVEKQKFLAYDGSFNDFFGYSVCIEDGYAIIGAYWKYIYGYQSGAVYIYKYDGFKWIFQQRLIPPDGEKYDLFGISVSLDGNWAIVGSLGNDENGDASGAAYMYKIDDSNSWNLEQKIYPKNSKERDLFGNSVCIEYNRVVVGEHFDYEDYSSVRSAYLFVYDGEKWIQKQRFFGLVFPISFILEKVQNLFPSMS